MKNILAIITVSLLLSSCKKDDPTPTPPPAVINTTPISSGLPANTTTINGVFLAHKYSTLPSTNTYYKSFAGLYLTGQPLQSINPTSTVVIGHDFGGSIKINNTVLKFETTNPSYLHRYEDTLLTPNYSQSINWAFTGDTSFAGFNINVDRGFPVISNSNFLPNAISKTQTLTLTFGANTISNTDSISVQLSGSSLNISKTVPGNSASVTFTPAEFSSAIVGGTAQFLVLVKNYSNTTINNKTHVFVLVNSFNKFVTINP